MLISQEYKNQVQQKHRENKDWGTTSHRYGELISDIINKTRVDEVLDYGCGKATLGRSLAPDHPVRVHLYDPGIPELDKEPEPRQMVVCTDVMEHIEPDLLDNVLDDLKRVTKSIGFIDICTVEAIQTLPDGRNAHLIVEPMEWWLPKLMERFAVQSLSRNETGFWVVVKNGD